MRAATSRRADARPRLRRTLAALVLSAAALLSVAAPSGAVTHTLGGGQLEWGVRDSFRQYIVGPNAQGTYTASGEAEVVTAPGGGPGGVIRFPVLGGSYNDETGAGELTVGGTVRFEGHEGALDLTLSNLCVSFVGGSSGTTYADVVSKDMASGTTETYTGIPVVDMASVAAPSWGSGGLQWPSIATTLNAAAVPAFGQYPAGVEFDPLAPLTATFGTPTPRPGGGPCRSVPDDGGGDNGGGDNGAGDGGGTGGTGGGGGGTDGGGGGGGTPVPLPIPAPQVAPRATAVKGAVLVPRNRVATVGTLRCGSASCAISVPKFVKVKIAGKRYRVAVLAPKRLAAERRGKLRVKLTRAARKALAGRRAKFEFKVTAVADGRRTSKTITVTLRAGRLGNG
jgi:hypothetical protein